jgi:hypothetical protein
MLKKITQFLERIGLWSRLEVAELKPDSQAQKTLRCTHYTDDGYNRTITIHFAGHADITPSFGILLREVQHAITQTGYNMVIINLTYAPDVIYALPSVALQAMDDNPLLQQIKFINQQGEAAFGRGVLAKDTAERNIGMLRHVKTNLVPA